MYKKPILLDFTTSTSNLKSNKIKTNLKKHFSEGCSSCHESEPDVQDLRQRALRGREGGGREVLVAQELFQMQDLH